MFSVLGARMLIAEVHASSRAAEVVGSLLRAARLAPGGRGGAGVSASLARTASASSASSTTSSVMCEAACGAGGCRGLCSAGAAADSASELLEIEEAAAAAAQPPHGGRHRRGGSSTWSSASGASIAAFAADHGGCEGGEEGVAMGLVPLYPPGKILWMRPATGGGGSRGGTVLGLYQMDQTSFRRFVVTLETAAHHLPDSYISALDRLDGGPPTAPSHP